jgi:t-SNARE complex subunit (syntaxin)
VQLNVKKKVFLAEQVNVILQNNNALKYKDSGVITQFFIFFILIIIITIILFIEK